MYDIALFVNGDTIEIAPKYNRAIDELERYYCNIYSFNFVSFHLICKSAYLDL